MIRFVQFEEEYLSEMAELLAERHRRERQRFSFLPQQFEDKKETASILQKQVDSPYSGGLVALRNEEVIGYLLYEFKQDTTRGRHVSISYPSLVVKESEHARLVRLMYAEAGAEWVRNGYFEHVIEAPLGNERVVLELLEQSFSFEQRFAVLKLDEYMPKSDGTGNVDFRQVNAENRLLLREMAHWNSIHQAGAPAWQPITKESLKEVQEDYESMVDDKKIRIWVAEQNDVPAAFHMYQLAHEEKSIIIPEKAAYLVAASTNIGFRGRGLGKAIADYSFNELEELGLQYVLVDWYTPNYLSSYFWPKLGFESFMIRMVRTVDSRISWAAGI